MDDLFALNHQLATTLGVANKNVCNTMGQIPVCLAKLRAKGNDFEAFLGNLPNEQYENTVADTSLNKEYLRFVRQTARDVVAGGFYGLIVLHIDMRLAKILAGLTNRQIREISFRWPGLLFEAAEIVKLPVPEFHATAALHYPAALLAA